MPRASLRSVFTGIVDSAVFTCRVSSSSTASPASAAPHKVRFRLHEAVPEEHV
jgi:hypothetical protein